MSGPPAPPPPPPSMIPGINPPTSNKNDNSAPTPAPSVMLNRDALLGQIRQGITLKKAETNDRSAPQISGGGVISSSSNSSRSNNNNNNNTNNSTMSSMSAPPVPQLGDLLAGGFPKLKHVNPSSSNSTIGSAPPIPNLQAPSIPKRRPSKGKDTTPNIPTNRPVGKSHQKKSSISYEAPLLPTSAPPIPVDVTTTTSSHISIPTSAPPPPPPTLSAPPIPNAPTIDSHTPSIKKESASISSPISPPPPPPQLPTFAAPSIPNTSTLSETPSAPPIPIPSISNTSSMPSAPPLPTISAPKVSSIPPAPPAPTMLTLSAPSIPSAPPPSSILNTSSIISASTSSSPPPPPPPPTMPNVPISKEKSKIKPGKSSKSGSSTNTPVVSGGPLPFLAEIQKKRDDRFVVSQDSNYSTYVEQKPVTQSNSISSSSNSKPSTAAIGATDSSMSFLSEIESKMKSHSHSNVDASEDTHSLLTKVPPLPTVAPPLPATAPPIPSSTTNTLTHNNSSTNIHDSTFSFANEISSQILNHQKLHHVTLDNEQIESTKLSVSSSSLPPVSSAPPLPTSPPPVPIAPAPPAPAPPAPAPPAPAPLAPASPAILRTSASPVASSPSSTLASVTQTSFASNTLNEQIHISHVVPPPPPPPPSASHASPSLPKTNATNNDSISINGASNDPSVATSSTSSVKHRLFASEGSFSSTKIDASAYTLTGSSTTSKMASNVNNDTNSGSSNGRSGSKMKIMIDDSRFNWSINESQMPAPRKFQNITKLYPSGGGSTIPLDLSLYE